MFGDVEILYCIKFWNLLLKFLEISLQEIKISFTRKMDKKYQLWT
jgi:hypothetical protein